MDLVGHQGGCGVICRYIDTNFYSGHKTVTLMFPLHQYSVVVRSQLRLLLHPVECVPTCNPDGTTEIHLEFQLCRKNFKLIQLR